MFDVANKRGKEQYQGEMIRLMARMESVFARGLAPFLRKQFRTAADMVAQGLTDTDRAVDKHAFPLNSYFVDRYTRIAAVFGEEALKRWALTERKKEDSMRTRYWQTIGVWARREAAQKVVKVDQTTKRNIATVVSRGMQEGKSNEDIAKEIRSVGQITSKVRARRIARTETHTASVNAVNEATKSTGMEFEREWVSFIDDRIRGAGKKDRWNHIKANGEKVGMEQPFTATGEPLMYPGDPKGSPGNTVNCRCVLLYHRKKGAEAGEPEETPVNYPVGRPTSEENQPMAVIGDMSECITARTKGIFYIETKERPQGCKDFVRVGGNWFLKGQEVVDEGELKRLNGMGLPPAWNQVTVSANPGAKIQAIGLDAAGRWQYRYSAEHVLEESRRKFDRVKLFSKDIPAIRSGITQGMANNDARAFLLELEDRTAIRAGSMTDFRAKKKAYGLTTLKNEHIRVEGMKVILDFTAKEGIPAHYELDHGALAAWLSNRKASTAVGEFLFPDVSAAKLNKYLKVLAKGKDYTIKDFRTYHGSRIAYEELKRISAGVSSAIGKKKAVKQVSEKVSAFLKNTPAMARKAYIDPTVWDMIGGL